jgi:hypothetical protein
MAAPNFSQGGSLYQQRQGKFINDPNSKESQQRAIENNQRAVDSAQARVTRRMAAANNPVNQPGSLVLSNTSPSMLPDRRNAQSTMDAPVNVYSKPSATKNMAAPNTVPEWQKAITTKYGALGKTGPENEAYVAEYKRKIASGEKVNPMELADEVMGRFNKPNTTPATPATPDNIFVPPDINPALAGAGIIGAGLLAKKFGPKLIKSPIAKAAAGLGTTMLGNEVVDYYAPRDARDSTKYSEAARGVGLVASGAAGGYAAGGPVGAVIGAVGNPLIDVYKTSQEIQQSKANTQAMAAKTAQLNQKYNLKSPENKTKAETQRLINQNAIKAGTYINAPK